MVARIFFLYAAASPALQMVGRLPVGRQELPRQELLLPRGRPPGPTGLPAVRHESTEEPSQDEEFSQAAA